MMPGKRKAGGVLQLFQVIAWPEGSFQAVLLQRENPKKTQQSPSIKEAEISVYRY